VTADREALRRELAEALDAGTGLGCPEFSPEESDSGCPDCEHLLHCVDALLPVVERAVAAARAEALEQAADDLLETDPHDPVEWLRARAAALAGTSETAEDQP
jgi:hypothetical protein